MTDADRTDADATDAREAHSASATRAGSDATAANEPGELAAGTLAERIAARFAEGGAPLMHEMQLRIVHAEPGRVRFVLPVAERLTHGGGVLCGQAIMACMDTGMVFAMMSLNGADDVAFTTVELKTTFERGVPDHTDDVEFEARITKPGRTLVFGQVDAFLPDGRRAASATSTYMWI